MTPAQGAEPVVHKVSAKPLSDSVRSAESVANAGYVRRYLRANLFDGDEGGTVTMRVDYLLDAVTELVLDLFIEARIDGADHES